VEWDIAEYSAWMGVITIKPGADSCFYPVIDSQQVVLFDGCYLFKPKFVFIIFTEMF
jgi:hypothetical protein